MSSHTSKKILNNSLWYGLETVLEMAIVLGTSIAVARYLGPEKLGYFAEINFPVLLICAAGGTGLAVATRKYMADYLGKGQVGAARAVYEFTYKYQLLGALLITALGLAVVLPLVGAANRLMAVLMVVSIIPGMMSWVPANANLAFEDAQKNAISSFGYIFSYGILIVLTLHFRWDLPGISASFLISRTIEAVLRTVPLHRFLRTLPLEPLPPEMTGMIRRFCLQAIGIQVLITVVWNRSEIFFLTAFSDVKQVAFYSVSAGLVDRLLIFPKVFGGASGVSLMTESARDRLRVGSIVNNAVRYLGLVALPVHIGAAVIASQAISVVYGPRYMAAAPVMMIAAIFGIPRAFQDTPDILMRSADRQWELMRCLIITGIINVALDFALIPHYGAVGAAIGNGIAQTIGVGLLWYTARKMYLFKLPWAALARIAGATIVMAAVALLVSRALSPVYGVLAGIAAAIPTYLLAVRAFHALDAADYGLLMLIGGRLPRRLRGVFEVIVRFMVPRYKRAQAAAAVESSV